MTHDKNNTFTHLHEVIIEEIFSEETMELLDQTKNAATKKYHGIQEKYRMWCNLNKHQQGTEPSIANWFSHMLNAKKMGWVHCGPTIWLSAHIARHISELISKIMKR